MAVTVRHGQCVQCLKRYPMPGGVWQPGQFCLFGQLFACSRECAETYARANADPGFRPGEPGFDLDEPAVDP